MIVSLENCKKCEAHKGMDESFVRCNYYKEFNVMAISAPSHDNPKFKNGERVVRYPRDI